jgi:hypothetical protein
MTQVASVFKDLLSSFPGEGENAVDGLFVLPRHSLVHKKAFLLPLSATLCRDFLFWPGVLDLNVAQSGNAQELYLNK